MVGSHDPRDPLFDPLRAPDPKLLSDFELDAAASADAELSATLDGDLDAMEYVETAKTEQKLRRSRREAEEAAAAARLEEQQSNTNESESSFGECDLSDCDNKTLSESSIFCPSCESTLCDIGDELDF